jgi:hypothetical protein
VFVRNTPPPSLHSPYTLVLEVLVRPLALSLALSGSLSVALLPTGCSTKEPEQSTYFDRTINPVLTSSCVRSNTGAGCHVANAKGNAFGNLDVSNYDGVAKRRDLLLDYGPYGQPAFLIKATNATQVEIQSYDGVKTTVTTDIKHTGGPILDPTASGYQVLRRWITNGATENNSGPPARNLERGPCNPVVPREAGFDPNVDPQTKDFGTFKANVSGVIQKNCSAGNCHGTSANELFFTCGDTPEQVRWNYRAASEYLAATPEQSELLRRPLSPQQGGSFHEGGVIFATQASEGYEALRSWAAEHGPPVPPTVDPTFGFFAHRVQPVLVRKGCMMVQCHSAAMFHDYRLRGGSGGAFSLSATRRNYELSLQQLSLDSEDVDASRIVRKNLYRPEIADTGRGIAHRGGPLFEDFGNKIARPDLCDAANPPYDYDNGNLDTIPGYCVIREWHKRERARFNLAPLSGIVYVKRVSQTGADRVQDFDVYSPGADLRLAKVTLTLATGQPTPPTADTSLLAGCGLDRTTADVRRPAVSWDGKKIAFAARSSAAEPLAIYEMNADGTSCAKHPDINAGPTTGNGLLVHNFDPAYSPPGEDGVMRIVFASTRGNVNGQAYDYAGPQRMPSDPTKPNSNLYVFEPDPAGGGKTRIRQLTFLLNTERQPNFMADGRVIMTSEKRAPNFYQLSLRRINLDGGDYHPLYAQRASIGYLQASSVVELSDKDFATVFNDPGVPHQGGQLGVFNRSIGIDFQSQKPGDYLLDPSVIDPAAPASPEPNFFIRSLRFPDGSASGRPGTPGSGVYATPAALPGGNILVSYAAAADPGSNNGDYDLYVMDKMTGGKVKILGDAGVAEVEAVAIYGRAGKGIFRSTFDEPNGHTQVYEGKSEADIVVVNMPILASLLFQNTPTGRLLDEDAKSFQVYEDLPPTPEVTTFEAGGANVVSDAFGKVYVRRRLLGEAPLAKDGSAHVAIPGGVPIVLKLPDTTLSLEKKLPRIQREAMMFYPGEYSHQSFQPKFFNSLCGQCHSAISGRQIDVAVQPDMLTQASRVEAKDAPAINVNLPPNQRGKIEGPPTGP